MNVRVFWVRAMECMCAQTRPRFILSRERVLGNGSRTHVNSKGKIHSTGGSEESRTRDASSRGTARPTHYRLSYSAPPPLPPPHNLSLSLSLSLGESLTGRPRRRCNWNKQKWMTSDPSSRGRPSLHLVHRGFTSIVSQLLLVPRRSSARRVV